MRKFNPGNVRIGGEKHIRVTYPEDILKAAEEARKKREKAKKKRKRRRKTKN